MIWVICQKPEPIPTLSRTPLILFFFQTYIKTIFGANYIWLCREFQTLSFDKNKTFSYMKSLREISKILRDPLCLRHLLHGHRRCACRFYVVFFLRWKKIHCSLFSYQLFTMQAKIVIRLCYAQIHRLWVKKSRSTYVSQLFSFLLWLTPTPSPNVTHCIATNLKKTL